MKITTVTAANSVLGCDRIDGNVIIRGDDVSNLNAVRLANSSGDYCAAEKPAGFTDSVTGTWFDPATAGQGFAIQKINENSGTSGGTSTEVNPENIVTQPF